MALFECFAAAEAVCVHVLAAAQVQGFTSNLRGSAAAYLVAHRETITVDADTGMCTCTTLADVLKPVHFRPQDGACTCHDRAMHGTCCHLLAAARLPEFAGVGLPVGLDLEGANDTVRGTCMQAVPTGCAQACICVRHKTVQYITCPPD